MHYQQLKEFAAQLNIERTETPLDALKLVKRLNIPYGNEDDAKIDFKGQINPLYEVPAFLKINKTTNERKIYYNSYAKYWNFYLMYEIAHYLLGHRETSYGNEIEADLLACILLVPPSIIKEKCDNAYRVCKLCNVPVDKADIYIGKKFLMKESEAKTDV